MLRFGSMEAAEVVSVGGGQGLPCATNSPLQTGEVSEGLGGSLHVSQGLHVTFRNKPLH